MVAMATFLVYVKVTAKVKIFITVSPFVLEHGLVYMFEVLLYSIPLLNFVCFNLSKHNMLVCCCLLLCFVVQAIA